MSFPRRHASAAPIRITTAGTSHEADIARRQRRYVLQMLVRCLCFIGAVIAGVAQVNWLWPILMVAAVLLPYVAVVGANASDTRSDELPLTGGGRSDRQLGPGRG